MLFIKEKEEKMLIVIPSLVILAVASLIVLVLKSFQKDKGIKEKRVIKEEHLYKKDPCPEC